MSQSTDYAHPSQAELLLRYLQRERENLVGTLDGLSDYDVRRPMTPTGTSLLGLVKHLAGVELGYLGDCVGRPLGIPLSWDTEEGYAESADMWARADESREELLELYRTAWAHGDESVRSLGLDAPAAVPWWPEDRKGTTVGYVLVHLLAETAHHAGHADIVREAIDGRGGDEQSEMGDEAWWRAYVAKIQAQADLHRS
jgi:uncharacterized damage-inducible protein DinB